MSYYLKECNNISITRMGMGILILRGKNRIIESKIVVLVLVVSHINVMNCTVHFHPIGGVPQNQQVRRSVHLGS